MSKTLKEKLTACENICGTHVSMNDPVITELVGYAGYDFVWIDTEHSSIDYRDLLMHLSSARMTGTPAIVRASSRNPEHVKRVLEMGPDGIIFPNINTPEEAKAAMDLALYPPLGKRGFGPLRATHYGADDIDEYIKNSEKRLCRLIQIESAEAVENLPEIVKNPYIDGYVFGPCDLSGSIGELNQVFGEHTQALVDRAISILKANHKSIGVSIGPDTYEVKKFWFDKGLNMISAGGDFDYILRAAQRNREQFKKLFSEK